VWTARVGKPKQLRHFVERLSRRVVARAAEEPIPTPRFDVEQHRMAAGDK
jgi:hypothetical protein